MPPRQTLTKGMLRPSNQTQPRIRPSTQSERNIDFLNKVELPLAGPLGDFLRDEVAGEMMGGGIGLAAGIIPKQFLRKLSQEVAERASKKFKGTPKIADVATIMAEKHPLTVGHLADFEYVDPSERVMGRFTRSNPDLARKIVERKPTLATPSKFYQSLLDKGGEEELARYAQKQMGTVQIHPNLENRNLAEIFKTFRHELGHASEDLMHGKLPTYIGPSYWPSQAEVRARAIERNYGRDMGFPSGNIMGAATDTPRRRPYSLSIMDELDTGAEVGMSQSRNFIDEQQSKSNIYDTLKHYYGKTPEKDILGGPTFTMTGPPRLQPANDEWMDDLMRRYNIEGFMRTHNLKDFR